MIWSSTGLYGAIPSDREPYRTKRSHTKQYRAVQDNMEPYRMIWSHKEL